MAYLKSQRSWQIFSFILVGLVATAVHFITLNSLVPQIPTAPANGLAFLSAVLISYSGQSLIVFKKRLFALEQSGRFLISALSGLIANIALMYFFNTILGIHHNIAFLINTVLIPFATFIVNKIWVFR